MAELAQETHSGVLWGFMTRMSLLHCTGGETEVYRQTKTGQGHPAGKGAMLAWSSVTTPTALSSARPVPGAASPVPQPTGFVTCICRKAALAPSYHFPKHRCSQ